MSDEYLTADEFRAIHEMRPQTPALLIGDGSSYKKLVDRELVSTRDGILSITPYGLILYHEYRRVIES